MTITKFFVFLGSIWMACRKDAPRFVRRIGDLCIALVLLGAVMHLLGIPVDFSSLKAVNHTVEPSPEGDDDCEHCPAMVWIPAGSFAMGSVSGRDNERPVHTVTLPKFQISEAEVTFAEFDAFVADKGHKPPDDAGWGRADRPVINVTWTDAVAYTKWLSAKTGSSYRLPTEAEWEYAARAQTTTQYWWGETFENKQANCWDCDTGSDSKKTMPVKSFQPNPFGIYDTSGNVLEWILDCRQTSYEGAPKKGSAERFRANGGCKMRGIRGGSWGENALHLTSTYRNWLSHKVHNSMIGFRIVKEP